MNNEWIDASKQNPPRTGIYLVFRRENRHSTTRQFYVNHGWQTGDTVLYWMQCPPPPLDNQYAEGVVWGE